MMKGSSIHRRPVDLYSESRSFWWLHVAACIRPNDVFHTIFVRPIRDGLFIVSAAREGEYQMEVRSRNQGEAPRHDLAVDAGCFHQSQHLTSLCDSPANRYVRACRSPG